MVCHTYLLHVSDSSSVHHQEFLTVHTAMICHKGLLRVSYSSSVRHQEISTIHTPMVYVIKVCYMFRTVPLSIIRNFSLYIQQWYMSYRFADSLRAGSGRNMFRTVLLSIIRSFSLHTQQWYTWYRFADSLRAGSGRMLWSCSQAVWHIPLLCVRWKTPDDGQRNCPKHVEFYSKYKFEKLVHLFGFIIRIYHDTRSPGRQITFSILFFKTVIAMNTLSCNMLHNL